MRRAGNGCLALGWLESRIEANDAFAVVHGVAGAMSIWIWLMRFSASRWEANEGRTQEVLFRMDLGGVLGGAAIA